MIESNNTSSIILCGGELSKGGSYYLKTVLCGQLQLRNLRVEDKFSWQNGSSLVREKIL